jgi:hypothetical protein
VTNSAIITISIKGESLPPINVIKYLLCFRLWVFRFDVSSYPRNEMVLEATLDQLM